MGGSSSWKTIHAPDSLPRLLVKHHLDKAGYTIYITDLSRIWVERLDRAAIFHRANSTGCTIEPGEDDQYQILLDKIKSSLNGDDDTSLSLNSPPDGQRLEMTVTAPLPSPLPDFKWTVDLARMTDDYVGSELVAPLMFQTSRLYGQIQSLIDEIQAKDRIISKITDRLETSGNDLTTVFPGVSNVKVSRKKAQRPQLAKYVKGLAHFQEDDWRARLSLTETDRELTDDVIDSIFTQSSQSKDTKMIVDSQDAWWRRLGNVPVPVRSRKAAADSRTGPNTANVSSPKATSAGSEGHSMSETDFETQSTPPHLKHGESEAKDDVSSHVGLQSLNGVANEESTGDEDDLDAPPKVVSSPPSIPCTPRKLGTIGGGNQRVDLDARRSPETAQPQPALKSKAKLGTLGGTAKRGEAQYDSTTKKNDNPESKPRRKLGAFGGKPKGPSADGYEASSHLEIPGNKTKLGTIGGKRTSRTTTPSIVARPRPDKSNASDTKAEDKEQVDEKDSQERADWKRDQLKRELEEKAKAPVKKKRRF